MRTRPQPTSIGHPPLDMPGAAGMNTPGPPRAGGRSSTLPVDQAGAREVRRADVLETEPPRKISGSALADEVADLLQEAILEGRFALGQRLNQDDLCQQWGVSRTPLREALRRLQALHLVEIVPNRGVTVTVPTRAEAEDIYSLRAELEGFACELAAANWSRDYDHVLRMACDDAERMLNDLDSGEVSLGLDANARRRLREANEQFHGVIHAAAGNAQVASVLRDLGNRFPKDYIWRAVDTSTDARRLAVDEHRAVKEGLLAGHAKRARRLMTSHVAGAGELLRGYLDHHQFWSS